MTDPKFSQELRDRVKAASDATVGSIDEPDLKISWDGACPVQGFGTIDGHGCYYRSRHGEWSFEVYEGPGQDGPELWTYTGTHDDCRDADGWERAETNEKCIREALEHWRAER